MCGIVAIHSTPDAELGSRMLDRITHRGPDDEGTQVTESSWLGHRRLSTVDLYGGHQPLTDRDGRQLVGNGEIYNHHAIRATLNAPNWTSASDNEVLLHSVLTSGGASLAQLQGMFAFAAAGSSIPFLAGRDPIGVKPLYGAQIDDSVLFASEMKAFDTAHRRHVQPFPPGCYWTPITGLVRFATTVPSAPPSSETGPVEDYIRDVRNALLTSVKMQMMGDVPVGVLLSGGLDSSIVAAIAARWCAQRGQQLQTFAVGTEQSDDLVAARQVATYLGTEHFERIYTADDAVEAVPAVIRAVEHYDPTLLHSSVANYLLAELAAQHTKVVLTGEGADGLFAGYHYLHRFPHDNDLDNELRRTLSTLHTLNMQRCDRTTMAFGLEGRVPFLDTEFFYTAMNVPIALRRPDFGGKEKYLLRTAFAGWLPDNVLWRRKAQFGDGSGMSNVLRERMSRTVSESEFLASSLLVEPHLRNLEEAAYHRIWHQEFAGIIPSSLDQSMIL